MSVWVTARKLVCQSSEPPSWVVKLAIDWAPLWAIVLLGFYGGGSVVYGVIALKDHKEAAGALEREVEEVKKELRKRGIFGVETN